MAGEVRDQPPGDRGGQQRLPVRDDPDRVDEFGGGGVLEQETTRAGPQRVIDILVKVEGREHQHPQAGFAVGAGQQLTGGGQPVQHRHPHVHQHHVGVEPPGLADRLGAIGYLAYHGHAGLSGEHSREALPDHRLVIRDQALDHLTIGGHAAAHNPGPPAGSTARTS